MNPGTKSLLFGEHHFLIHPLSVAAAWWKLFGFPWDLRLWVCFFVHDWGYWGKPNIDGEEGKTHPELGAAIAHWLFDPDESTEFKKSFTHTWYDYGWVHRWYKFCLCHSRHSAEVNGGMVSRLALADKLSFIFIPWWAFILLSKVSGCIAEYLDMAVKNGEPTTSTKAWYRAAVARNREWVYSTIKKPSVASGYYCL